jgi:hypothetical protein
MKKVEYVGGSPSFASSRRMFSREQDHNDDRTEQGNAHGGAQAMFAQSGPRRTTISRFPLTVP